MPTLNSFFDVEPGSLTWARNVAQSPAFTQAYQAIEHEITGLPRVPLFREQLLIKLWEVLDLDLAKILARGWSKHQEIVQYRDRENPPGGSHVVHLLEHKIASKHSPTLEPVIDGVHTNVKLKFDIVLTLEIKGFSLAIRDGKIIEIATGTCTGSGAVKYAGIAILERKTAPVTLPGLLTLKEGVAI